MMERYSSSRMAEVYTKHRSFLRHTFFINEPDRSCTFFHDECHRVPWCDDRHDVLFLLANRRVHPCPTRSSMKRSPAPNAGEQAQVSLSRNTGQWWHWAMTTFHYPLNNDDTERWRPCTEQWRQWNSYKCAVENDTERWSLGTGQWQHLIMTAGNWKMTILDNDNWALNNYGTGQLLLDIEQ